MSKILHVAADHPLNRLSKQLRDRTRAAQTELIDIEFASAYALLERACDDLKLRIKLPDALRNSPVTTIADLAYKDLFSLVSDTLVSNKVPEQAVRPQASNLAHRVQLIRAFHDPDRIIDDTCAKVSSIVSGFPRAAAHIQRGRNPGDVLDPYILAATQQLLYAGDLEGTITATVAHKSLMIIEGLLGHLHEDVIGAMRGNVRAPEPRGADQETLDPLTNPFPGADVVQPPLGRRRPMRFHQVKSKTGSAKGGDGRRLGLQLMELQRVYGGELYYDALIGNTLRGHRSMAGVLRAAPNVVVLVGDAAFRALTESTIGPELLLRLYQTAFDVAAQRTGYRIQEVVDSIYASFREQADRAGEGFLDSVLHDAIRGAPSDQDSRLYRRRSQQP